MKVQIMPNVFQSNQSSMPDLRKKFMSDPPVVDLVIEGALQCPTSTP